MSENAKPLNALEFIDQIAPPGADETWKASAIFLADSWSCSIKKYITKQLQNENKPNKDGQTI